MKSNDEIITKEETERFSFEYQRLQERVQRDSSASYTLMTALVALSQAIIVAAILNREGMDAWAMTGAAIASMGAYLFWYPMDRRFVWAENIRLKRMNRIEQELKIYNDRLFHPEDITDSQTLDDIETVGEEAGFFSEVSVHRIYLLLAIPIVVAWILLIYSTL